jgi:hypothetical protein
MEKTDVAKGQSLEFRSTDASLLQGNQLQMTARFILSSK